MDEVEIIVRPLRLQEWDMAIQLAWDTFLIYDAPMFTKEGVKNFEDFVKDSRLKEMYQIGTFKFLGAYKNDMIVGMLGTRGGHISLLFVDSDYQNQGIATALLSEYFHNIKSMCIKRITVNSSPYAVSFYRKLGFKSISERIKKDGICYTPMIYDFY